VFYVTELFHQLHIITNYYSFRLSHEKNSSWRQRTMLQTRSMAVESSREVPTNFITITAASGAEMLCPGGRQDAGNGGGDIGDREDGFPLKMFTNLLGLR